MGGGGGGIDRSQVTPATFFGGTVFPQESTSRKFVVKASAHVWLT